MLKPVQIRTRGARVRVWTDTGTDDLKNTHGLPVSNTSHGAAQYDDLDFEMLVEMRRKHQTKQAASGVRMKKTTKASDDTSGLRGQIIRQFHEALKEAQDERAAGTGLERDARWRGEVPAAGNAANAAAAAAKVSKQVSVSLL